DDGGVQHHHQLRGRDDQKGQAKPGANGGRGARLGRPPRYRSCLGHEALLVVLPDHLVLAVGVARSGGARTAGREGSGLTARTQTTGGPRSRVSVLVCVNPAPWSRPSISRAEHHGATRQAAGVHLADRSSAVKSPTGPRRASLSGLTIALMLVI